MKKTNPIWRLLIKLHRYTGLFSAVILLMLAVTGIALNHTEDLKLDEKMVNSPAILNWYKIKPPDSLKSFSSGQHWLTLVNHQLYFDHTLLMKNESQLLRLLFTHNKP